MKKWYEYENWDEYFEKLETEDYDWEFDFEEEKDEEDF